MSVWGRYVVGGYQSGEGSLMIRGRASVDAADRLIVLLHGREPLVAAGTACLQFAIGSFGGPPHVQYLAEHGYVILSIDAGGKLNWGNDASQTAVANAITWARAQGFCHPTAKVGLLGYSMGGAGVLNYAHNNAGAIAGVIGEAPAVDLAHFYPDPTYGPELDAAYGGSYPTNGTTHNPQSWAASLTTPMRLYSAVDDPTVPNSLVHTFYSALTMTNKSITDLPGGGHANFFGYIDQVALRDWLDALSW